MAKKSRKTEKNPNIPKSSRKSTRIKSAESFLGQLKSDRSLWFIIYFAIVIAYLLLNQGGSIDLNRAPVWAFRAFAFGGLILFSILDSKRIRHGLASVNLLGILPITLVIIIVTSNIVTIRPFETVEESMNILAYASLAFLCYIYINSLAKLRQFIEIVLAFGFMIAFHGLYIFYGALWSRGETTPLSGLFYWHNPCAGFLLLIWPSMLAQYYSLRRGWQTFLILYIFYITFTAFGLTLSRGGWLAGFIPFLFIPFFLSRKKLIVNWRPVLLFILYFASAIPFVIKYRGQFFQPIIDRWNQMRLDDYSVVGRFEFWEIAWKVFLAHPIFGIGFNTFGYYYPHYQTNPQYYTKDFHNIFLGFLVEGGIAGGLMIATIVVIVAKLIIRTVKEGPNKLMSVYRIGLLAGIFGELLHNGIDFDWTFPVIPLLLVCQIAVVARSFKYSKAEQELTIEQWEISEGEIVRGIEQEADQKSKGVFIRPVIVWQLIAIVLFIANVLGFMSMTDYEKGKQLMDNQSAITSERTEQRMSQLEKEQARASTQEIPTGSSVYQSVRTEVIQEAMAYWKQSLKFNPWNWYPLKDLVSTHYFGALDLYNAGAKMDLEPIISAGLDYSYRLLKVTPHRAATFYYVGQFEILAGKVRNDKVLEEQGLQKSLRAIDLDPKNIPKYYLGIAQYYYDEKEYDLALQYVNKMDEIFVPYGAEGVDFGALKGKSLARQDWVDICETMRDAWWLMAEIYTVKNRPDDALTALYNGFNTPVGGGESMEKYIDLGMKQLPFAVRIAEISFDKGDYETAYTKAKTAIDIINKRQAYGTGESRKAFNIFNSAKSALIKSGQLESLENQNKESGDNE